MKMKLVCLDLKFFIIGYFGTLYAAFIYTMCKRQQRREANYKQWMDGLDMVDPELGKQDQ